MNLTLRLADTTLFLSLADQHSCSIELTDFLRTGLESCCETYAALRQSGDNAAVLALGERLAELMFTNLS